MTRSVELVDVTLREGEQQAGVRIAAEDKVAIVGLLERLGVMLIEVGHPAASHDDELSCRAVAESDRRASLLMHARARRDDVLMAAEVGADWVGIWAAVNDVGLRTKFPGCTPCEVLAMIRDAVACAKDAGLRVRYTVEDASRTPWKRARQAAELAVAAGADRISLADTVGVFEPERCARVVGRLAAEIDAEIEVHCHDDLGLALANTLAAIDAGASAVDASVLGLGERAGVTDLLQLVVALRELRGDDRFDLSEVVPLAQAVQLASGHAPDSLRPVTGRNAFVHASAYHAKAVRRCPDAYEPYAPQTIGRTRVVRSSRPAPRRPRLNGPARIARPFPKESAELKHHRDGPGQRWVLLDSRVDDRASFYAMARVIVPDGPRLDVNAHVDTHSHHCDSALVFMGATADATGLHCRVTVGDDVFDIASPATVFVPATVPHSYAYVDGWGTVLNVVLSADYNMSVDG